MLDRLEVEGRSPGTVKEYRIAIDHLATEYGVNFSLKKIRKDAVIRMKKPTPEPGLQNADRKQVPASPPSGLQQTGNQRRYA